MSGLGDPPRWLDSPGLADDVRRELAAYAGDGPSVAGRARMRAQLEARIAAGAANGATTARGATRAGIVLKATRFLSGARAMRETGALSASGASTLLKAASLVKLALAAGALCAGAAAGFALWSHLAPGWLPPAAQILVPVELLSAASAPPSVRFSSLPASAVAPAALRVQPASERSQLARRPHADVAGELALPFVSGPVRTELEVSRAESAALTPSEAADSLAAEAELVPADSATGDVMSELALLARARRALLTQPPRALELAAQHAREYGHGMFAEEREILAIEALLKLGRVPEARTRAEAFDRGFPNSAQRVHLIHIFEEHQREH